MKWLIQLTGKAEGFFRKMKNKVLRQSNAQFRELEKWYADDPHSLKRSEFPFLHENSIVFDLGGYEGQWSSDIFSRYGSNLYIFEPVAAYAKLIRDRFEKNKKIRSYPFGLAEKTYETSIIIDEFASRITDKKNDQLPTENIQLESFDSFVRKNNITKIDLIKINIEGAEYPLISHFIDTRLISSINGLLVQFHDFVPGATSKRQELHRQLSLTHNKIFDYPFVWEYWQLK